MTQSQAFENAIHEAGHLLAALSRGLNVSAATVTSGEALSMSGSQTSTGCILVDRGISAQFICEKHWLSSLMAEQAANLEGPGYLEEIHEDAHTFIFMLVAGPVAHVAAMNGGKANRGYVGSVFPPRQKVGLHGPNTDMIGACRYASVISANRRTQTFLVKDAVRQACDYFADKDVWRATEKTAALLLDRGTLTAGDIYGLSGPLRNSVSQLTSSEGVNQSAMR